MVLEDAEDGANGDAGINVAAAIKGVKPQGPLQ